MLYFCTMKWGKPNRFVNVEMKIFEEKNNTKTKTDGDEWFLKNDLYNLVFKQ